MLLKTIHKSILITSVWSTWYVIYFLVGKVNGREPTTDTNTATAKEEFQQTANTAINAEKEDLQPTASVTVVKEELPEVSVCFEPEEADFEGKKIHLFKLCVVKYFPLYFVW